MNAAAYNDFCKTFDGAHHVVQWRGADVWKVGDKVFAIGRVIDNGCFAVTFKATDIAFRMLPERPGVRPAPYMASRGLKWLQHYRDDGLADDELRDYIDMSYRLVVEAMPKKTRRLLGLEIA